MTRATLVVARGDRQQAALDGWLRDYPFGVRAVVAEGAFHRLAAPADVAVTRIAAGCACCVGQVPMRVALVRTLRAARPESLLILVSDDNHLGRLRSLLADGSMGVQLEIQPGG